jgi:hypothetical protein
MICTPPLAISLETLAVSAGDVSGLFPSFNTSLYDNTLSTPLGNAHSGVDHPSLPLVCDDSSYNNILPMAPEDACFGDNLRCATVNSRGSGEHFAKVEVIVDFAVDEMLDFVFVTELKTTRAKVAATNLQKRGFFSWWSAWDVQQSHNDGILLLVRDEWAKYVQKIDYWNG